MKFKQKDFEKVGEYSCNKQGDLMQTTENSIKRSLRLSLVYVMTIDGECMYIGKTIQGYIRPLSYHKNKVMKSVRDGIIQHAKDNKKIITVLARSFQKKYSYEDLELDLCEAYEQALIKKYKPSWNNHIQSD